MLAIVSGLTFGYVYLVFANWIALLLSSIGGLMFAFTYKRSSSMLVMAIEHGLWGDLIFTIGLGIYFYSGAIS